MPTLPSAISDDLSPSWASTPHRHTDLLYDVPEEVIIRPAWGIVRKAEQMALATQSGFGSSVNVALLPSGVWTLRPLQYDWHWEGTDGGTPIIDLLGVIAAAYIEAKYMQKPPNLPGIIIAPEMNTEPSNQFMTRRVPAGADWTLGQLFSDVAAFPQPQPPTQYVPMLRVISGTYTFRENQGFMLRFYIPATTFQAQDNLCTFYFGGDTDVYPPMSGSLVLNHGGAFAVTFRGNGIAILWELARSVLSTVQWVQVLEFRYAPQGQVSGKVHTVFFVPHRSDKMDIFCETADIGNTWGLTTGPRKQAGGHSVNTTVYHHNSLVTGVTSKRAMTGMGVIRMDVRADLRLDFQPSYLWYPENGVVIDHNFNIPFPLEGGTPIWLSPQAYLPALTNMAAVLCNGLSGAPLTQNLDGSWNSVAGVTQYFAKFAMSTADRKVSPFLYAYQVYVPGLTEDRGPTPFQGGIPKAISITGPTSDPTQESAHVRVEDTLNQLEKLRHRGRFHTRIRTKWDPADLTKFCVLMEGEIPQANAVRRGRTGRNYPNPQARTLEFPMVSMWARNSDQLWFGHMRDFAEDPNAAPDPTKGNYRPPYKITDIARIIFSEGLGIPGDMLDIPDLDFRAFISGKDPMEYVLQPTASVMDYLGKLIKDHLGYFLIWDANATGDAAKKRGMWRILPPALPPYTPLWNFQTTGPGAGKLVHVPQSYAARTSPCWHYSSYVRPPEANYIVVTAVGELLPGKRGSSAYTQFAYNPASWNFDGSRAMDFDHPDYLGRFVPFVYFNGNLMGSSEDETRRITDWVTRRFYNQIALAQKWVKFTAPLVLVDDASDAALGLGNGRRPLRYYDPITLDGNTFLVHSVEMTIDTDFHQTMFCEALAADNSLIV